MTENPQLTWLAQKRHNRFHHPQGLTAEPYLTLPFKRTDLPIINKLPTYNITEGFRYSRTEQRLHRGILHCGLDFSLPYGTPIVAPCDGLAIASYHSVLVRNKDNTIRLYKEKYLGYGLGYFVQIHVSGMDRIVQLGHLSNLHSDIPFSLPTEISKDEWLPTNYQYSYKELMHNKWTLPVKTGDLLGWVGYSGMRWGYHDYETGSNRPIVINPKEKISYDEPHVHLEEGRRVPLSTDTENDKKGMKIDQRDPEDIYLTARNYPTPRRYRKLGPEPLFYTKNGLPLFAE